MPDATNLRMEIHEYIRTHPAAHILEIADAFKLTHPTVMYHLDLLADEGYVLSSLWGKRRVHFDTAAHFTAWEREVLALVAVDEARGILEHISASPGTYPREIAQTLGISDTTVKRYVPELLRLGIVSEVSGGLRRRMHVAKSFAKKITAMLEKMPRGVLPERRLAAIVGEDAVPEAHVRATRAETRALYRS